MKKRNTPRIYWIIIAVLVVLNLVTLATLLWRPEGPPPPDRERQGTFLGRQLGFDQEQMAQFRKLRQQHFEQTRALNRAMQENKRRMIGEVAKNPADTAAAFALTREIGMQMRQIDSLLIKHYLEIKSICTPEQQERLGKVFRAAGPPPGEHRRGPRGR